MGASYDVLIYLQCFVSKCAAYGSLSKGLPAALPFLLCLLLDRLHNMLFCFVWSQARSKEVKQMWVAKIRQLLEEQFTNIQSTLFPSLFLCKRLAALFISQHCANTHSHSLRCAALWQPKWRRHEHTVFFWLIAFPRHQSTHQ